MPRLFHVHGGQAALVAGNGLVDPNLVWKNAVLADRGDGLHPLCGSPQQWLRLEEVVVHDV
jgi:hypothetical protein